MIILVDMDGTIADWNFWIDYHADVVYPEMRGKLPRAQEAEDFNLFAGLSGEEEKALLSLFNFGRFYRDIPPIEGAIEAVTQMMEAGHDVFFVTSPWFENATCMEDKVAWIKKHFSPGAENRIIITKDKTTVKGDVLIDDKPEIRGVFEPEWKHILFHQKYNAHLDQPRIIDWKSWSEVVTKSLI